MKTKPPGCEFTSWSIFVICISFAILLNFGGELIYPESESTSTTIIMMTTNGAAVIILEILNVIR